MGQKVGDTRLGIKAQPLAVLAALADYDLVDDMGYEDRLANVRSYAWYNGRERGIAIVFDRGADDENEHPYLVCVVNEHRNSDALVVDWWTTDKGLVFTDGPTLRDFPGKAYHENRQGYGYMRVDRAVDKIRSLTKKHAKGKLWVLDASREGE